MYCMLFYIFIYMNKFELKNLRRHTWWLKFISLLCLHTFLFVLSVAACFSFAYFFSFFFCLCLLPVLPRALPLSFLIPLWTVQPCVYIFCGEYDCFMLWMRIGGVLLLYFAPTLHSASQRFAFFRLQFGCTQFTFREFVYKPRGLWMIRLIILERYKFYFF